jgi:hypothetical protein
MKVAGYELFRTHLTFTSWAKAVGLFALFGKLLIRQRSCYRANRDPGITIDRSVLQYFVDLGLIQQLQQSKRPAGTEVNHFQFASSRNLTMIGFEV